MVEEKWDKVMLFLERAKKAAEKDGDTFEYNRYAVFNPEIVCHEIYYTWIYHGTYYRTQTFTDIQGSEFRAKKVNQELQNFLLKKTIKKDTENIYEIW
jgi:hypothetical protein